MENYRSLEAYTFFVSGWVQTVLHMSSLSGTFLARGDVRPSWRVTEEPHHPWVALKKEGPVIAAHCDCMAGLGETCSHVAALLFKMEAAVRLGYTSSACIDNPCVWNQCFVKNVQPAPVANIKFYKNSSKEKLKSTKKRMKHVPKSASESEQLNLLQELSSLNENIVALSGFKDFSESFIGNGPTPQSSRIPPSLRQLYKVSNASMEEESLRDLCNSTLQNMSVSSEDIHYVEEVTKNQAACATWHDVRVGRVTASIMYDVMHTSLSNPSKSLISKICQKQGLLQVPAVQWGTDHEDSAFNLFAGVQSKSDKKLNVIPSGQIYMTHYKEHTDFSLSKAGFIICKEKPYIGVSPDGHIDCACCGKGVLEIKCPYKYKDVSLKIAVEDNTFCVDKNFRLKDTHKYFAQVQLQMIVCDVQYADFMVWTPVDCISVDRQDAFISDKMLKCDSFWKFTILPELLTRKLENATVKTTEIQQIKPSLRTYCVCKTTDDSADDMVGCDGCDQWYHPACINLKRLPRTKTWYCRQCKV